MGCNNPVHQVLQEAEIMFPRRHVTCIISIGAEQAHIISIPKSGWSPQLLPLKVVDAMQQIATDCEASAQDTARRFKHMSGVYCQDTDFSKKYVLGFKEKSLRTFPRIR